MFDPQAVSLHLCLTWRCTWRMWAPIACQRHTPVVCNWTCDLAPLWGVFMVNGLCFQWPLIMVNTGNIVNGDIMEYSGFTYKYIYTYTHLHNQGFLWEYCGDMVGHISIPHQWYQFTRAHEIQKIHGSIRCGNSSTAGDGETTYCIQCGILEGDLDQHQWGVNTIYCSQQVVNKIENQNWHMNVYVQGCFRRKMNCGFLGSRVAYA
jgi:hypothetical protein